MALTAAQASALVDRKAEEVEREKTKKWYLYPQYNLKLSEKLDGFQLEKHCFLNGGTNQTKFYHLQMMMGYTLPDLVWNEWLERQLSTFCDESYAKKDGRMIFRNVSMVGCASAGKTFSAGLYAYHWFMADPFDSIVILTSTTKEMIGSRIWPIIQYCYGNTKLNLAKVYNTTPERIDNGNLVDSKKMLQAVKGNEKNTIKAIAVRDGETSKAEANIRGQHAKRILVVVDEANKTPEAIFGTIPNLRTGCEDFTIITIGNPESRLDPHGKCCEPTHGFSSRPPGCVSWKTKGVVDWQIEPGICLQFRGDDSPNVKAGKTLHPHLYTYEDYQASFREGVRKTLRYWVMAAGEWAPDGFCNTVFNETMLEGAGLRKPLIFRSKSTPISFLDPAFGGDSCVQKVALLGDLEDGRTGINITASYEIELDQNTKEDYEHQIARQVKANCLRHGVEPYNFGLDSTAIGRGVASILYTDWSTQILKLEFGGRPSDLPASADDRRPACEVYDRKVTELWFSAREFALGKQLGNLDDKTIIQACGREYDMVGKKYRLETKEDCKVRMKRSPDDMDALCGLVAIARTRHGALGGGVPGTSPGELEGDKDWKAQVDAANAVYENVSYTNEESPMESVW